MFVPENDELCPFEPLQNIKTEFTKMMPNIGHSAFGSMKDEEFMKELIGQMTIAPGDEEHSDEL